jgi:hypothetical protein
MADDAALTEALARVEAFLGIVEPRLGGLADMKATSLSPMMAKAVDEAIAAASELRSHAVTARAGLRRLLDAGFPSLPVIELEEAQARELEINDAEHNAALVAFRRKAAERAANLNLTGGPEPV